MSKTTNVVVFVLGTVVGSMVTWQYLKKRYEQIAQEEIDSIKAAFTKREVESLGSEIAKGVANGLKHTKEKVNEYAALLQKEGYINDSNMSDISEREGDISSEDRPYVIYPEEFGEFNDYEKISLTYYADQILADENDELIDDVEDVVGFESLAHFGEYENDSVFVRNDRLKSDYEILIDRRLYSDVVGEFPHRVEVR